jgi:hypothetical protein
LVGGSTNYDASMAGLTAILAEWARADASYNVRVAHISGAAGGGLNGSYRFTASTVHTTTPNIFGTSNAGLNWYIANTGDAASISKKSGETVTVY